MKSMWLMLVLSVGCSPWRGCTMAERSVEAGGHRIHFDAARVKQVGLAGGGGGHIGIFVPVIESAGWKLRMKVGDGPHVVVDDNGVSFSSDPDPEHVKRVVDSIEVAAFEGVPHLALKIGTGEWTAYHLFDGEHPFRSPRSALKDPAELKSLPAPERLVEETLMLQDGGAEYGQVWDVVEALDPGRPWDARVIELWGTKNDHACSRVRQLAESKKLSELLRAQVKEKALLLIDDDREMRHAVEALASLKDDAALEALDLALIARWPQKHAHGFLQDRFRKLLGLGHAPMSPKARAQLGQRAIAEVHQHGKLWAAVEIVDALDDDAVQALFDDRLLELWPEGDSGEALQKRLGFRYSSLRPQWKASAIKKAEAAYAVPETRAAGAELLFGLHLHDAACSKLEVLQKDCKSSCKLPQRCLADAGTQ